MKKWGKIAVKAVACTVAAVVAVAGVGAGYLSYARKGDLKITIDKNKRLNSLEGFGASACWWAQYCGNTPADEEITKLLFSKEGLGLNIFRYNIGGGEADNPKRTVENDWRASESFYVLNESTGEYEYDFTRDKNAQRILELALSYGTVDTVVLFANSPHYSMTASGKASGGLKENQSNLPRENYEKYADYFLTITEYFLEKGVPVKYISPINEPQWSWGGEHASQEGCHYEDDEIYELCRVFAREIKARNLPVKLSVPESGEIGNRTNRWIKELYNDSEVREVLGTVAYHSYWRDDYVSQKADFGKWLEKNAPDATVEMSEWCHLPCTADVTDIKGALLQARVIANDLRYTGADSWSAWVGVNGMGYDDEGKNYSDGLITANDDFTEYAVTMRYYAMAHFSKFIPVGSVRLDTQKNLQDLKLGVSGKGLKTRYVTNDVSYLTPDGKVVTVVVNEGSERNISFNLDGASKMTVYTTTQSEQLKETYNGEIKAIALPQNSIITVVFE